VNGNLVRLLELVFPPQNKLPHHYFGVPRIGGSLRGENIRRTLRRSEPFGERFYFEEPLSKISSEAYRLEGFSLPCRCARFAEPALAGSVLNFFGRGQHPSCFFWGGTHVVAALQAAAIQGGTGGNAPRGPIGPNAHDRDPRWVGPSTPVLFYHVRGLIARRQLYCWPSTPVLFYHVRGLIARRQLYCWPSTPVLFYHVRELTARRQLSFNLPAASQRDCCRSLPKSDSTT